MYERNPPGNAKASPTSAASTEAIPFSRSIDKPRLSVRSALRPNRHNFDTRPNAQLRQPHQRLRRQRVASIAAPIQPHREQDRPPCRQEILNESPPALNMLKNTGKMPKK
jgi:hypothetical protein